MPVSGRSWDVAAPGPSRPLLSVMLSYAGTGVRGAGALLASTSRGDTRTVARIIEDTSGLVSIGQLALDAGVSSRTIRYYEELGIIPEPHRSAGGTRKYPREFRGYIETALVLKDLGFRLEEIKPLAGQRRAAGRRAAAGGRPDRSAGPADDGAAQAARVGAAAELRDGTGRRPGAAGACHGLGHARHRIQIG